MNLYVFKRKKDSPQRSTHTKEAIQCDRHQTQDWDQGQHDEHAAQKQTARGRNLGSTVHHHCCWYGHAANQEVGRSQGDDQAQGGLLEGLGRPKRQDNQRVPKAAQDGGEDLQGGVGRLIVVHFVPLTDREQGWSKRLHALGVLVVAYLGFAKRWGSVTQWGRLRFFSCMCCGVFLHGWFPFGYIWSCS